VRRALGVCFQWILVVPGWVIVDFSWGDGCARGTWRLGGGICPDSISAQTRRGFVAASNGDPIVQHCATWLSLIFGISRPVSDPL
jgi:hypothetical protein